MTTSRSDGGSVSRRSRNELAEVIELVLDKGLVIDLFVKVSLIGIELVTIDARIVVASVDTYLRFAAATNRLDLHEKGGKGLTEVLGGVAGGAVEKGMQGGAKTAAKGVLDRAHDRVRRRS